MSTEDQMQSADICAICLECEGKEKIKCGHEFHEQCVEKWLSIKNSCPICRQPDDREAQPADPHEVRVHIVAEPVQRNSNRCCRCLSIINGIIDRHNDAMHLCISIIVFCGVIAINYST